MKYLKKLKKLRYILAVLVIVFANFIIFNRVSAGTLAGTSVVELGSSNTGSMQAGDPQEVAIEFSPATTSASSPSIVITFTGWTGGAAGIIDTATSQVVSDGSCTSLFAGYGTQTGIVSHLTGVTVTSSPSAGTITINSTGGTLASGSHYCTTLTDPDAVTNPSAAGEYSVNINDGTDSQTDTIDVLNSGGNSYSITGTVGSNFTMSLSSTSDSFGGNLQTNAVKTSSGITTTISTDAASGWEVWVEDEYGGLHSTTASKTIASVPADTNEEMYQAAPSPDTYGYGSEAYALGAVSGTNSPTIQSAYAYSSGHNGGGLSDTTFYELADQTTSANASSFTTHELANISVTTPPATDYTDTITEIGAGSF